ncbi:Arm DNA-binding domain-containing protein [Tunturiibacter gelidiferens]|uniref:Arm DNA-binding domain-containing protein n=1 Tax=Tunturiibacter gelidiferens TaxID=3069689 RepID=UPI003D9BC993
MFFRLPVRYSESQPSVRVDPRVPHLRHAGTSKKRARGHNGADRYGDQKGEKREKAYKLSDGRNLYLWITPSGGKLWRWAYRHEGKEKLMTFGRYPEVSLALARERHVEARKLLAVGV